MVVGNTVYVATEKGLYRSEDGSESWELLPDLRDSTETLVMAGDVLYAGTVNGILRSTDRGASWQGVYSGGSVVGLAVVGKAIYALVWSKGNSGICCSTDGGNTWQSLKIGIYNRVIKALVGCGDALYVGTDGGLFCAEFGKSGSGVSPDVPHDLKHLVQGMLCLMKRCS